MKKQKKKQTAKTSQHRAVFAPYTGGYIERL
jgi:hypothetical protein